LFLLAGERVSRLPAGSVVKVLHQRRLGGSSYFFDRIETQVVEIGGVK
jgi:hypothetical protein